MLTKLEDRRSGKYVSKYEFVSRYGIPLQLHIDQGRNLESELFKNELMLLQIINKNNENNTTTTKNPEQFLTDYVPMT